MPIYEYRCRGCGRDFEKYLPTAATPVTCPECESGNVMRKLSVFDTKSEADFAPAPGGGCCGGACACH